MHIVSWTTVAVSLVALLAAGRASARAEEAAKPVAPKAEAPKVEPQKVEAAKPQTPKIQAPKCVAEALQKLFPTGVVGAWHTATQDKVVQFATRVVVETRAGDGTVTLRKVVVVFGDDGTLVSETERLAPSALPAPVTKAIAGSKYAKGTVLRAARTLVVGKPDATRFEVLLQQDAKKFELELDAAGKILEAEEEDDEDGDDDSDGDDDEDGDDDSDGDDDEEDDDDDDATERKPASEPAK